MDPIRRACTHLLSELEGKNTPLTVNDPSRRGLVFAYSGDYWERFSEAIRQGVDKVKEYLLDNAPPMKHT